MQTVVLFIHLAVCVCLIGLVLLQRSEGGALGMGGGGGALMSGRGAADALARMTSIAGGFFLATSLGLTFISGAAAGDGRSVLDMIPRTEQSTPAPVIPAPPEPLRSDPTESTAPQAEETLLASMAIPPAVAAPSVTVRPPPVTVAPAPLAASTRAAPLTTRPAAAISPPTTVGTRAQPISAQRPAATPPATLRASSPTQRTPPATIPAATRPTPTVTRAAPAATRPLILPNTSGAGTGQPLTTPAPALPESVDVGNGVEGVRRERAGPDQ